jgi:hypothetical protein
LWSGDGTQVCSHAHRSCGQKEAIVSFGSSLTLKSIVSPILKIVFAVSVAFLFFVNWLMTPRSINQAKIDFDYLLNNCSSLIGATVSDIDYDSTFIGGGVYVSKQGEVALRSGAGELFCISYVACLTKPILLPDCNKTN